MSDIFCDYCPHCACGRASVSISSLWEDDGYYVVCPDCKMRGPLSASPESACSSWNKLLRSKTCLEKNT